MTVTAWKSHYHGHGHHLRSGCALLHVHRYSGQPGWWLTCVEAGLIATKLAATTLESAKQEAITHVAAVLRETSSGLETIRDEHQ